ncbi:MAG: hypothetical protein J6W37_11190 [Bacteroidales bacterium]|nr:hypothetical protein [Bacteroidales bacterium]
MKNIESQQLAPQIGEVILYNPDDTIRLEVRMNDETVGLFFDISSRRQIDISKINANFVAQNNKPICHANTSISILLVRHLGACQCNSSSNARFLPTLS